jgi:hypothetical protein
MTRVLLGVLITVGNTSIRRRGKSDITCLARYVYRCHDTTVTSSNLYCSTT